MAVEDKYVDTDRANGYLSDAARTGGSNIQATFNVSVAAADDDGSIYRIVQVPSNSIPFKITIGTTAITGGTDYDLGFYDRDSGSVVDKDILMDGQTMATASKVLDGVSNVSVANASKAVWELLGLSTDPQKDYDLALTANTVGTAAGDISVKVEFLTA